MNVLLVFSHQYLQVVQVESAAGYDLAGGPVEREDLLQVQPACAAGHFIGQVPRQLQLVSDRAGKPLLPSKGNGDFLLFFLINR